jgi:CubicO group peptidase (beta-lactamase class C family)
MGQTASTFEWKKSDPEAQGIASASILRFIERIEEEGLELHSLMIVRNGYVVAEGTWAPYRAEIPHLLNSLSKSFTSTAIGLAAEEGRLKLTDRVLSFFPEYVTPEIEANMKELEIQHLLSMSTGHTVDTTPYMRNTGREDWVRAFLEIPIERPPGTHFLYNTGATYMLSAILHRATGQQLLDYLEPRLFAPLGITDVTTMTCPRGIHTGGFGMKVKIADIAKFGLLYLQEGIWEGKRILPAAWVRTATAKHIDNGSDPNSDWAQGYGYQFWRCRHGAYRGDGAFGQFCIVIPDKQAVIAITSGEMEMQAILNAVWEELLPGMKDSPLSAMDDAEPNKLKSKLQDLAYPAEASRNSTDPSIRNQLTYQVADNAAGIRAVSFRFGEDYDVLHLLDEEGKQELRIAHGEWADNMLRIGGETSPVSVCGRWVQPNMYEIELRFLDQAYRDIWTCHFVNDSVQMTTTRNVVITPGLSDKLLLPELAGAFYEDRDM